jgi:hypothetical protein
VEQDMRPDRDNEASKKIFLPRAAIAEVPGLGGSAAAAASMPRKPTVSIARTAINSARRLNRAVARTVR